MKTKADEILEWLEEMSPDSIIFRSPDYKEAIVGVTHKGQVVYDRQKCIEILMEDDECTWEQAEEFFSYNTERGTDYMGPLAPIIVEFFHDGF